MKRIMAILLTLSLLLCLTGCGFIEEELSIREAQALIKKGEYAQAIELLRNLDNYQQITELLAQAQQLKDAAELQERIDGADFLFGIWKSIDDDTVLEFSPDGNCTIYAPDGSQTVSPFRLDGDRVSIDRMDVLLATSANGVTWLTAPHYSTGPAGKDGYRFVREENYETYGPKTIAITMENWEQYFELREQRFIGYDDLGEAESLGFGYGIYLREEFIPKLRSPGAELGVAFRLEYDSTARYVRNSLEDDYSMGSMVASHGIQRVDSTQPIMDMRFSGGEICAHFYSSYPVKTYTYFPVFEKAEVTEVAGSIVLYP